MKKGEVVNVAGDLSMPSALSNYFLLLMSLT
jgi:hypothetical protein